MQQYTEFPQEVIKPLIIKVVPAPLESVKTTPLSFVRQDSRTSDARAKAEFLMKLQNNQNPEVPITPDQPLTPYKSPSFTSSTNSQRIKFIN